MSEPALTSDEIADHVVLRIVQVLVSDFCVGILNCFLCSRHFQMGIPHILVRDPHWHAELHPRLALCQPRLVTSWLHMLRHLVMVAPCPVRSR